MKISFRLALPLLLPVLMLAFGCSHSKNNHSLILKLKQRKKAIDTYLNKNSKSLTVLVKVPGKTELVVVKDEQWPDSIQYTYNILRNAKGNIILVAQIPNDEAGDWFITYRHYFNEKGKTFAFSCDQSIFTDQIKGGVLNETTTTFYDENFVTLKTTDAFDNKDARPLKIDKNKFEFPDFKYDVYKSLGDCLAGYRIKIAK